MSEINRILIFGNSGSGKSTFAKELSLYTKLPYTEIDNLRWDNEWHRVPSDVFENKLSIAADKKQWIVEDGSTVTLEKFKDKADLIIWLKVNTVLCLVRLIKRSCLRWSGKDEKTPEPFLMALKHWRHCLKYKFYKKEKMFEQILRNCEDKLIIIKNKNDKQKLITYLKEQQWEN